MEAELSDEDGNDDFALTVARLALQCVEELEGNTAKLLARWRRQWHSGAGTRRWRSSSVARRRSVLHGESERESGGEGENVKEWKN